MLFRFCLLLLFCFTALCEAGKQSRRSLIIDADVRQYVDSESELYTNEQFRKWKQQLKEEMGIIRFFKIKGGEIWERAAVSLVFNHGQPPHDYHCRLPPRTGGDDYFAYFHFRHKKEQWRYQMMVGGSGKPHAVDAMLDIEKRLIGAGEMVIGEDVMDLNITEDRLTITDVTQVEAAAVWMLHSFSESKSVTRAQLLNAWTEMTGIVGMYRTTFKDVPQHRLLFEHVKDHWLTGLRGYLKDQPLFAAAMFVAPLQDTQSYDYLTIVFNTKGNYEEWHKNRDYRIAMCSDMAVYLSSDPNNVVQAYRAVSIAQVVGEHYRWLPSRKEEEATEEKSPIENWSHIGLQYM